jgi:hypothetical protein
MGGGLAAWREATAMHIVAPLGIKHKLAERPCISLPHTFGGAQAPTDLARHFGRVWALD